MLNTCQFQSIPGRKLRARFDHSHKSAAECEPHDRRYVDGAARRSRQLGGRLPPDGLAAARGKFQPQRAAAQSRGFGG